MVWELFVVEALSPSARRDAADGHPEGEERQSGAAVSPAPHSAAQRRRPAARTLVVVPEADVVHDGLDWDKGGALPF